MKIIIIIIIIICSFALFFNCWCYGQSAILPGDKSIDKNLLKNMTNNMAYSISQNGTFVEIGNYKTEINYNNQTFEVKTSLSFKNANNQWEDHFIANPVNFKTLSITSEREDRNLSLNFDNEITGYILNNKTRKKTIIKEKVIDGYFDISMYPYILPALPLTEDYKANIPVFDYEAHSIEGRYSNVKIIKVKSDVHRSTFTGEHKVWLVSVFEESTKQNYDYYIDKETRKIWRINLFTSNGETILLINKESDYDPLISKFDKIASLKLIKNGTSVIKGQAFARDNKNGGAMQGMAVLNVNKKQFAAKGTIVLLMPYTEYFKEWVTLNEFRKKKLLPQIPLPEGAEECIMESKVFNDKGNFEIKNLMPGQYLLTIKLIYSHSASETEIIGSRDLYINGVYQGSNDITVSNNFVVDAKANIKKVVTISKAGEIIQTKLKQTL